MKELNLNELVSQMEIAAINLAAKVERKCYVVAGYGGDTLYSYVAGHKGYNGADLIPEAHNPQEFSLDEAKIFIRDCGFYKNGRDEKILLQPMPAADYYSIVLKNLNRCIAFNKTYLR